jgi:hypothetical protein
VQWELGVALRELFELDRALRGEKAAAPPPLSARPRHARSNSAMGLLHASLRRVGFAAATAAAAGDGIAEEARSLVRRAHVKSSSHLSGLFAASARPPEAARNRSSSFLGLGGFGADPSSSSTVGAAATTTTTTTTSGRRGTFFEPMMYRIRSHRRRIGQTHNRYQSMIYAHEMLGMTGKHHVEDGEKYPMMHSVREGSGSSADVLDKIRRQSIGSESDGKMMMIMEEQYSPFPTVSAFSKLLNLASAGLFMCNFNIIAPTSGLYADLVSFLVMF